VTTATLENTESRKPSTEPSSGDGEAVVRLEQAEQEPPAIDRSAAAQPSRAVPTAREKKVAKDSISGYSVDAARQEKATTESEAEDVPPRHGEVYKATVVKVHQDAVIVRLAEAQRDGFVSAKDLEHLDPEYRANLKVGDQIAVRVLKDAGRDEHVVVSIDQGLMYQDWSRAEDLLQSGEVFEAKVTDFNRGGVLVSFGRLEGFVPNSHLERLGSSNRETKAKLVGQTLSLVMIETDQRQRRLVLSERAAGDDKRQQVLAELTKGQVRTGIVRNLVDFGVFVDLGGVDGLIHISELDWKHVHHPSDVLSVGDEVEVYVLDVDREQARISLSRKYLLPRPWDQATPTSEHDDLVASTVTDDASHNSRAW
jgi:small subunit ribosomal protein S1